jgi:hypothetical protein
MGVYKNAERFDSQKSERANAPRILEVLEKVSEKEVQGY